MQNDSQTITEEVNKVTEGSDDNQPNEINNNKKSQPESVESEIKEEIQKSDGGVKQEISYEDFIEVYQVMERHLTEKLLNIVTELHANDLISGTFEKAVVSHETEQFDNAVDFYLELLSVKEIESESKNLIIDFKHLAEKGVSITEYVSNDTEAIKSKDMLEEAGNFITSEEQEVKSDLGTEEKPVNDGSQTQISSFGLQIASTHKTADEYYADYQEAYFVSDLWSISQEFKELYPNDSRVSEVVNHAARKNLDEAHRVREAGNDSRAIVYYNRILNEDLVDNVLQEEAKAHINQIDGNQQQSEADEYYEKYQEAYFVSDLWSISQEFKSLYPDDFRVNEVVNHAVKENLIEGHRLHNNGDYKRASVYYKRVLNEPLVKNDLQKEAQEKLARSKADADYERYQEAYFVSELWSISQEFKSTHSNDSRVNEVVNHAAKENLKEGQRLHNNGQYDRANVYYNRVLDEPLVTSALHQNAQRSKTNALYDKFQETYFVSELWKLSQEFKSLYPNDSRVNEVVSRAVEENFKEGQRAHQNGEYDRALVYYNRVLNEALVDSAIQSKASAYKYLADNNLSITDIIVKYTNYDLTLSQMVDIQMGKAPQISHNGGWRDATKDEVKRSVNPSNSSINDPSKLPQALTTVEINTGALRVRTGPSTQHKQIGLVYNREKYTILDEENGWYKIKANGTEGWISGSSRYVSRDTSILQHLELSNTSGISVSELNKLLEGKGILHNMGDAFRVASQQSYTNELYLISHALLETGHGTSVLAKGIEVSEVNGKPVTPQVVYNMFGIGAYDSDPERYGSERAYELGWFTPEEAIIGGAKWIANSYVHHPMYQQNTLYKMRWNPSSPGIHQYATDIDWAYKQTNMLNSLVTLSHKYGLVLNFDIPLLK